MLTSTDLVKPPGESKQEWHLSRKVFAHPVAGAPEHFYTKDLQWDHQSTHTEDNDSLHRLNEEDAVNVLEQGRFMYLMAISAHQGQAICWQHNRSYL